VLSNVTNVDTSTTTNITEGTKLFYTEGRVNANTNVAANTTHRGLTNDPHNVTKDQVGLGSVENQANASQVEAEAGVVDNKVMTPLKVSQAITAQGGGVNPNELINSTFAINQEVVSGTVILSSGEYGHDQWRAGAGGCTYTFATSLNVTTITISAGTLEQEIDGTSLQSGNYILGWDGTAQGQIDGGGFAISPVLETLVGGVNSIVEFNTGTLFIPKLEKGTTETEFIPKKLSEELIDCQYYFEKSYNSNIAPGTVTQDGSIEEVATRNLAGVTMGTRYIIEKRIAPTIVLYSTDTGNGGVIENGGDKAASASNVGTTGFKRISITSGDTATARYHYTADARF
jgi:hypothetical protein